MFLLDSFKLNVTKKFLDVARKSDKFRSSPEYARLYNLYNEFQRKFDENYD